MPKISLRAYNREIENLIERGQTDAAIAHCRHILKFYPKHIDTYRLLGKAYLEAQRYAEAGDIFHRVLSSVPDDFISQIGMSIIREDEGNLDAAIWHMERAFETQPSNTAIQDELRRLYGRRDGIEPPRIRLTRGALIRMYARGELYPQAIAEARAALAEDPNRIDLEVILARMYYLSGQKVAATEVCTRLVGKLPYCFEANRILAEILPTTSRAQDANIYRQRVIAMDPYLAHMTPGMLSPLEVPDNAVMLDYLEWQPELETPAQPEWTRTIGVTWLAEEEEALPDWYSALQEQPAATEVASSETTPSESVLADATEEVAPPETESLIPDWMRDAGWEMRTSDLAEEPQEATPFLDETTESLVEPAEIPEWLQDIVPSDLKPESETEESPEQVEVWFENLLQSGVTQTQSDTEEASPPEASAEFEAPLTTPLSEEEPPAWLADLTIHESVTLEERPESPTEWPLPDWALESTPSSPAHEGSPTTEEMAGEPPLSTDEIAPPETAIASLSAEEITPGPQPLEAGPTSSEDIEAALAWLESLAARQGADEATLTTPASERLEQPPAWVIQAQETEVESTPPAPPSDTLSGLEEATAIDEAKQAIPNIETVPSLTSSSPTKAEIPLDSEAAFAWLEGLAARQGVDEETLFTPPEQRSSFPPEWVSAEGESGEEIIEKTEGAPVASEKTIISPEEPSIGEVSGVSEAIPPAQETIPEWLQEVLEPPVSPFEETETSPLTAEISFEPSETIEDTQPVRVAGSTEPTPPPPAEEENIPEWLQETMEPMPRVLEEEESAWIPEDALLSPEESQPTVEAAPETPVETTLLWLHEAQTALQTGNVERALQFYNRLIQEAQHLEEVIHDLHEALYRYPIDVGLWQALGDAYVRSNRLQEALDAYTKAEELLR